MNYNEINENHPMAWESLMGWLREKQPNRTFVLEETGALKYLRNLNVEYFNIRDLYDFFDEKGILIHIYPFHSAQDGSPCFQAFLEDGSNRPTFSTRAEAEAAVFSKAFEILEEKL